MASSARIDELKKKFDENQRRYFAPLANEFRKAGDLDQAITICEAWLPDQPGHMSGHIVYGQALYEAARLDEARTVFETALGLDPENLIALRHLGDIAGRQGDAGVARRWYERVLEADPRNEEIQGLIAALDGVPAGHRAEQAAENTAEQAGSEAADVVTFDDAPRPEHVPARSLEEPPEPRAHDLDATLAFGMPAVFGPRDEALSLDGIVPMSRSAAPMPEVSDRADGFESTEFEAPAVPVQQTAGLQSAFEDETGVFGAALGGGLHESVPDAPSADAIDALAEDDGLTLPPHGDPMIDAEPAPASAVHDRHERVGADRVSREPSRDVAPDFPLLDGEMDLPGAAAAGAALPVELPPEVIAAEAELTAMGLSFDESGAASPDDAAGDPDTELPFLDVEPEREPHASMSFSAPETTSPVSPPSEAAMQRVSAATDASVREEPGIEGPELEETEAPTAHRPFVTETMAELYLKQGFREEAISVYRQLSEASSGDERLRAKVQALVAEHASTGPVVSGPTVRDFLSRIAARRPGERVAAAAPPGDDDFAGGVPAASTVSVSEAVASAVPERRAEAAPAVERAPASERPSGSIDALFGTRATTSEDSAASALAQAFGSSADPAPAITGNPARPASGELSLDSVFRDGSSRGRASQGFSFDQFFSQGAEGDKTTGGPRTSQEVPAPGEPAEKSADDIEQFNSWLQGLKQR